MCGRVQIGISWPRDWAALADDSTIAAASLHLAHSTNWRIVYKTVGALGVAISTTVGLTSRA